MKTVIFGNADGLARLPGIANLLGEHLRAGFWNDVLAKCGDADLVALLLVEPGREAWSHRLRQLRGRHPQVPVVLVVDRSAAFLRSIADLKIDQVCWWEDPPERLLVAIRAASTHTSWQALVTGFQQAGLPDQVEEIITTILQRRPPFGRVSGREGLARALGIRPRTLNERWQNGWRGAPPVRVIDLVHWVQLLHAYEIKDPANRWGNIAGALGATPRTLRERTKRLAGFSLSQLQRPGEADLLQKFDHVISEPLVGTPILCPPADRRGQSLA